MIYNVQDYSFLDNNAVCPVICEGFIFYSHVESTCMSVSFHKDGMSGTINQFNHATFYQSNKPDKSEVMYMCVKGIYSASFYTFSI